MPVGGIVSPEEDYPALLCTGCLGCEGSEAELEGGMYLSSVILVSISMPTSKLSLCMACRALSRFPSLPLWMLKVPILILGSNHL